VGQDLVTGQYYPETFHPERDFLQKPVFVHLQETNPGNAPFVALRETNCVAKSKSGIHT
jgi:hypothetical protein